ncbi:MAG: HlyC/CorC family transporter [Gammaproteobacteria bacterium]|nr:HlyC/CorC family transporter [Gammaproteobacteria bacterium]NNF66566.1 HlyC/CorC family transporter [Gammaproteobacteria bacterium]
MNDPLPTSWLMGALVLLLMISAFFSGTETALMSINRYRLRHRARAGHRGAQLTDKLLQQPDRLIGFILLGNTLSNLSASAITTVVAYRIGGAAIALSVVILTFAVLIFAELTPKTLAVLKPSRLAIPSAYVYYPLLKITYPILWLVNGIANSLLFLIGVRRSDISSHALSSEELRTVVNEAAVLVPSRHRRMLTAILDLEKATVEDIMTPRQEITGIDLQDDWEDIEKQLNASAHTRLPVFSATLDNTVGMLHLRKILGHVGSGELDHESLRNLLDEPYYVPEGTSLNRQLLNFQAASERVALVVDEYGDIQGLTTLQDILEEIVGEFTADHAADFLSEVIDDGNGFLVQGSANIRVLNRSMHWTLPVDGAKTINGLITEHLETIPLPGTSHKIGDYTIDIVHTTNNVIKTVRVQAPDSD